MKRIFLLVATNIAIMVVLSIVVSAFGLDRHLTEKGLNLQALLAFSAVLGFGGAFISLLISKWMAKMAMGVQVITEPRNADEQWLMNTVRAQAQQASIGMPEVGVFESPDPNAFATGASKNSALVAVSTGLLRNMRRSEVEAVLGHEVSHVANGDMVTLTLIQGVMNTFVFFLARVIGFVVDRLILKNERSGGVGYFVTVIAAQLVLGILAGMIVAWFSRQREFRADAGGAHLAGTNAMVGALEALRRVHSPTALPEKMQAFGIRTGPPQGWQKLFMSHPPLEERIAALQNAK
ncbi:MAG TPA: protease HtpX [Steroidobacteraceae bacterium]|nr:protease HtpX [Steroidobacteraceae bacterium]